jgi:small conductance mechanosensitive channel
MNYFPELLEEIWLFIQQPLYAISLVAFVLLSIWSYKYPIRKKLHSNPTLHGFLKKLFKYLFLLGIVLAPFIFAEGIVFASLAAIFVGFTIAFKGALEDVAFGVLVLVTKHVKIDDYIEVAGYAGAVKSIGPLKTELKTAENLQVFIPTSEIWQNSLINYSHNEELCVQREILLDIAEDPKKAKQLIWEVLNCKEQPPECTTSPTPPSVITSNITDNGIVLKVNYWVHRDDHHKCIDSFMDDLWAVFRENNIKLA